MITKYRNSAKAALKQRGFTLTEIAIVLGIIGLILGAIWVAAASVYSNMRVSKAQGQILTIVQNIRSLYATSTLTNETAFAEMTATVRAAGVFPSDMLSGTATQSPWATAVQVYNETRTVAGDAFSIVYNDIPTAACISLVTSLSGNGRDPGLFHVGYAAGASTAALSATTLPVSAGTAAGNTACGSGATPDLRIGFNLKGG